MSKVDVASPLAWYAGAMPDLVEEEILERVEVPHVQLTCPHHSLERLRNWVALRANGPRQVSHENSRKLNSEIYVRFVR